MIHMSRSEWIIESEMKDHGLNYSKACDILDRAMNEQLMYQTTMKVIYLSDVLVFVTVY